LWLPESPQAMNRHGAARHPGKDKPCPYKVNPFANCSNSESKNFLVFQKWE